MVDKLIISWDIRLSFCFMQGCDMLIGQSVYDYSKVFAKLKKIKNVFVN